MDAIQASFSLSYFCLAAVACSVGAAGVAALRLGSRSNRPAFGSLIFFGCLTIEGLLAMCAMVCNSNSWLAFGAVLTAMAVGATLDLGRAPAASTC